MQPLFSRVLPMFLSIWMIAIAASAQTSVSEYMEQARTLMMEEKYEEANVVFRRMLSMNTTLPEDMSYLFAETLYQLGQNQNSQNFLTKYLTLTGRAGNYFDEALRLQNLLDIAAREIQNCQFCNGSGYRMVDCNTCRLQGVVARTCTNCRGIGRNQCEKCFGEGVLVSLDKLGTRQYATCDQCDGRGIHVCRLCAGTKVINSPCPTCLGSLQMRSNTVCNHQPLAGEEEHDHDHDHAEEEGQ